MGWSETDDNTLQELWLRGYHTAEEIGAELGRSRGAVHRRIIKLGMKGRKGDRTLLMDRTPEDEPVLRPIYMEVPTRPVRKLDSVDYVSLHWSDIHYPFQDDKVVEILYQVARDLQPTHLYMQGDLLDFYQLSDYRPPEDHRLTPDQADLQEALEMGTEHLALMQSITNAAERHYLMGNHEDRWNRLLLKAQQDSRLQHILRLPALQNVLTLEFLMGLKHLGWETYPYVDAPTILMNNRLVVSHGYRATIWCTRASLSDYGKSVIFGHSHRIQQFTRRDLRGTDGAWSIGCMCDLNPWYRHHADWHQGFAVVVWRQEADGGFLFNVEQIRVHDGKAIWRDRVFSG